MQKIYDFIGIGIGPFNLGLAALTEPLEEVDALFFDQREKFDWHAGMLLEGTHLQVPFMADLVTMADPCSQFSFLNYLKKTGRLYPFYIREDFFLLRSEYNLYCQWVCEQLSSLHFSHQVKEIHYLENEKQYKLLILDCQTNDVQTYYAHKIVLGTGTVPSIPTCCQEVKDEVVHTSNYLHQKEEILQQKSITIVGGGQSAAEIYYDLLNVIDVYDFELNWITRSPRFFPLEYSKLTLEMTSPEYVDYFHSLPSSKKESLNKAQKQLYKGINFDLINQIYDLLYRKSVDKSLKTKIYTNSALTTVQKETTEFTLSFFHTEKEEEFKVMTESLILATGYHYQQPSFLKPLKAQILVDEKGKYQVNRNYSIDQNDSIFVQNAEFHTHGFVTPDLGMGAYRNVYILKEITGKEYYPIEKKIAFQEFGVQNQVEKLIYE